LKIDDKLEFGRLLDWQVAGLFTLEDAIDCANVFRNPQSTLDKYTVSEA
jgi:hypothetical protein